MHKALPPHKVPRDPFSGSLIDRVHLPPASREEQPSQGLTSTLHSTFLLPCWLARAPLGPRAPLQLGTPGSLAPQAASLPHSCWPGHHCEIQALLRGPGTKVVCLRPWRDPSKAHPARSENRTSSSAFRNL